MVLLKTEFYYQVLSIYTRGIYMLIVYDTRTNNVKNFLKDCNLLEQSVKLTDSLEINQPFILVLYTTTRRIDGVKLNGVPSIKVERFLSKYGHLLKGVAASGEKNWGIDNFAKSADYVCHLYPHAELILKFEKRGTKTDREKFLEKVGKYE